METLVQAAKRLGIKPNPNMTLKEFEEIRNRIRTALKLGSSSNLGYSLYNKKRHGVLQNWDEKKVYQNIAVLKSMNPEGIRVHDQDGGKVSLDEDAVFVWHSASLKPRDCQERFAVSIKLDDPKLPSLYGKLDDFIRKYRAGFKITDVEHADRTDTLNVYMSQPITPEIAKEFYDIVMPFLKKENHGYLDGFSLTNHGHEIQGIKYGPEPNVWSHLWKAGGSSLCKPIAERIQTRLKELPAVFLKGFDFYSIRDAGSLGMVSGNVRYLNLLYYLAGREGQNPFQLGNQYGLPFNAGFSPKIVRKYTDKKIDIATAKATIIESSKKTSPSSKAMAPRLQITPDNLNMQDLLREIRSMRSDIQSMSSELLQLRQQSVQMNTKLASLRQENVQLRSKNHVLRAQIQTSSPVLKSPKSPTD